LRISQLPVTPLLPRASFACSFSLYCCGSNRDLPSFPTRRSSDLGIFGATGDDDAELGRRHIEALGDVLADPHGLKALAFGRHVGDRKSTRLNSSHVKISYAVFCLKKKKQKRNTRLRMMLTRNKTV